MSLQCGIVGLPNVGKSTLFNCLSNAKAQSANFPFCTIEPNVGVITVPDERLIKLGDLCKPERGVIPTTVEIVDIAGLVKGASKGEGLGNKFLANIRETDAIIHVLRCFDDDNVVHVDGTVDPVRDKEIIDAELQLKDLETVESRIQKCEKAARAGGDKQAKLSLEVLEKYREALSQGRNARTVELDNKDQELCAREMFLLTNKPVMYVCNVDEASAVSGNAYVERVREAVKDDRRVSGDGKVYAGTASARTRRQDRERDSRTGDLRGASDVPGGDRSAGVGRQSSDQVGLRLAEPAYVLHGGFGRGACLDFQGRFESPAMCRRDPYRL